MGGVEMDIRTGEMEKGIATPKIKLKNIKGMFGYGKFEEKKIKRKNLRKEKIKNKNKNKYILSQ